MKFITLAIAILMFMGCATSIPKDSKTISDKISIKHDEFKNQTWIETPLFLSRQGFTDTFPVRLKYRALVKNNELEFIQLYVIASNVTWGFYHSAVGEDGKDLEFIKIDSEVDASAGMVTTEEHFGMEVPIEYLEKLSQKDWKIKVYGKRNEGVFIVPASLSKSFLDKVVCYQADNCA